MLTQEMNKDQAKKFSSFFHPYPTKEYPALPLPYTHSNYSSPDLKIGKKSSYSIPLLIELLQSGQGNVVIPLLARHKIKIKERSSHPFFKLSLQ